MDGRTETLDLIVRLHTAAAALKAAYDMAYCSPHIDRALLNDVAQAYRDVRAIRDRLEVQLQDGRNGRDE